MMYRIDQLPAQPFLSDEDQRRLINTVQLAPWMTFLEGGPAAVEEAQERLTLAFLPVIKRAARASKVQDPDDALGNVLEEFLRAVNEFDLTGDVPFHATVGRVLSNHVSDTDRTSGLIRIPETAGARYWRLMHSHGMDVESAYRACRTTANGLDPLSFLAIHRAMEGTLSMDFRPGHRGTVALDNGDGGGEEGFQANYGVESHLRLSAVVTGPEERVVEEHLVAWLFTLVDDRQASILRLIYGFRDDATESLRFATGYPTGLDLSDAQAAHALGLSRPTVQRQKSNALKTMRSAMQQLVDDDAV